jgi:hypothetical protein
MGSAPAQAGTRAPFHPHRTIGHLPRGLELLARRPEEGGARPRRSKDPVAGDTASRCASHPQRFTRFPYNVSLDLAAIHHRFFLF